MEIYFKLFEDLDFAVAPPTRVPIPLTTTPRATLVVETFVTIPISALNSISIALFKSITLASLQLGSLKLVSTENI